MTDPSPLAMLVEDEDLLAEVVAWTLEDAGYAVIRAADGEKALFLLADVTRLDLLVTDIRMPGTIDGWTLAERIRDRLPDVPVVYVSGFSASAPRKVTNSVFVQKPFRPEQLISAIEKVR